tara:strand:- start:731 stop:1351 length:621 start_codon:yes stop_codon:yes gene_type:complete
LFFSFCYIFINHQVIPLLKLIVNYKLLINKIIIIFIFLKIITFSNLLFSESFSDFEEQLLPEIILFDENKLQTTLSSYLNKSKNNLTIINFWATWCPPCIKELPSLNRLANDFKEKRVIILAVSMDRGDEKKLTSFLKKNGGENLIFFQDKNWSAGKSIPIKGLPVTIIVQNLNNKYKIIYKHEGPLEWDSKEVKNNILSILETIS